YTLNGFEIPTSLDRLITIESLFNNDSDAVYLKLSYVLYLIPFLAFANIILDLAKSKFNMWIDEFVIGIITVLLLFIIVKGIHENATSTLSIGYYLTMLFSLLGIFSTLIKPKKEAVSLAINQTSKEEVPINDKSSLLNQLSQLHSLREKNVISEEIYEQERLTVLSKLQPQEQTKEKEIPAKTIVQQQPTHQPTAIYEEKFDPEYEELFKRKKWYQKPVFWVVASVAVITLIGFTALKTSSSNLATQSFSDTGISKIDPVIVNNNKTEPDLSAPVSAKDGKSGYKEIYAGSYSFLQDLDCGIIDGNLEIIDIGKGSFKFTLSVSAPVYDVSAPKLEGAINGVANFVSDNVAIFKNENCEQVKFTFLNDGIVKISESNCNYYHGTGICFNASFMKPENK
ncbi:MAG: hypothetical protein ACTHMD_01385, partial [Flavisolibacter sp.]